MPMTANQHNEKPHAMRGLLGEMGLTAIVTLAVAAIVTYVYTLLVHSAGVVSWDTSFFLAFVFGIVLPLSHLRNEKTTRDAGRKSHGA